MLSVNRNIAPTAQYSQYWMLIFQILVKRLLNKKVNSGNTCQWKSDHSYQRFEDRHHGNITKAKIRVQSKGDILKLFKWKGLIACSYFVMSFHNTILLCQWFLYACLQGSFHIASSWIYYIIQQGNYNTIYAYYLYMRKIITYLYYQYS